MKALHMAYLRGLDAAAIALQTAKGAERNRLAHQLLTGARAALGVVEAVDRVPAAAPATPDGASDGLPTELVVFERRYKRTGARLALRARWCGEGAERTPVVSIESERLEAGAWRALPWSGLRFGGRELVVVAQFFADAAKAAARVRRQSAEGCFYG